MAERVCVAQIGGPHGLRGEVKLKSFTADPMAVKNYGPLTTEDGSASFEIEALRPAKGHLVARLRGIGDRNAAERLANLRLFVLRERLPPPAADEFYHADLIGLEAVLDDGTPIGRVRAVHDFGAGDTLELERPGSASVLVPFTRAVVPIVEPAECRLVLDPPPGLLDDGEL